MPPLRRLHRSSAVILGLFVAAHLSNHLVAVVGTTQHIHVMEMLRVVYRWPPVEALVLASAVVQIGSGLALARPRLRARVGGWARLQWMSGLATGLFLLVHVSAVLGGRALLHLDTNFYFAAAGTRSLPFALFFLPYYWMGVAALAVHLAGVLRRRSPAAAAWLVGGGALLATLLVLALAGVFDPQPVPARYLATYRAA